MKNIIWNLFYAASIALILLSCGNSNVKHPSNTTPDNSTSKEISDSSRITQLLSNNEFRSSSLTIKNDSIFFYQVFNNRKPIYYSYVTAWFNVSKDTLLIKQGPTLSSEQAKTMESFLRTNDFQLRSVGNPQITYAKLPDSLKGNQQLKELLSGEYKIQLYNNKFYILDIDSAFAVSIYNPISNRLTNFKIRDGIIGPTDFFVYDINKDGDPEIFIFSPRYMPNMIACFVYTIKNMANIQ